MTAEDTVRALVRGRVQGVGYRPFVALAARALNLVGRVRNVRGGVEVVARGKPRDLEALLLRLVHDAPRAARVDEVTTGPVDGASTWDGFAIDEGDASDGAAAAALAPDLGPCDACLAEARAPVGRRAGYAFTTCAACGPRFTIARSTPWARARTAMAAFPPCADCLAEQRDPADRRFGSEAHACAACGPRPWFEDGAGRRLDALALARARDLVRGGGILALKGLGGWQLACDATDGAAVRRLRERKRRPAKPLALMVGDVDAAARLVELDGAARAALVAPDRPILLAPRRAGARVAEEVAPGLGDLGLMLPTSTLHALLLDGAAGPWVVTSGNVSDEPLIKDDDEARRALAGIADGLLGHDREVWSRADDSVVRLHEDGPRSIRRARGHAPDALRLPVAGPDVIAFGYDLKATVCVTRAGQAVVSQHLGDLTSPEVERFLAEAKDGLLRLLDARPVAAACDLHPDAVSTRLARETGLPLVQVQHHHAHAAACLVEHGRVGPALAMTLDGAGHGQDGAVWGGELLVADLRGFRRVGGLRAVALPGGDVAARQPWRAAVACLVDAGLGDALDLLPPGVERAAAERVRDLAARGIAAPPASSAGRLFDAAAALAGLRAHAAYEGQAAMELEALAERSGDAGGYPLPASDVGERLELDPRPLIRALTADVRRGVDRSTIARRFHRGLAAGLVAATVRLAQATGLSVVALGGGCFQSRLLLRLVREGLAAEGLEALAPARYPAGDGGLSLGQAAVATARSM